MNAAADCLSAVRDIADMARTPGISSNADDVLSNTARMRALCEIEAEPTLEESKEVPLCDMTEAELCVVILHDPELSVRREALNVLRQDLLLNAQTRTFNLLGEMAKARKVTA